MIEEKPTRRTLKFIEYYPTPRQLYNKLVTAEGYDYKQDQEFYKSRDRALCAITYLLATRISETLRLTSNQFIIEEKYVYVTGIRLSKSTKKGKPRKDQFRQEAFLPLNTERTPLTKLVLDYLNRINGDLFLFGRVRAYQIIVGLTGFPCHWLRAFGENYLYDQWGKDLLAVADYVKVNPQTLSQYIRQSYKKYTPA